MNQKETAFYENLIARFREILEQEKLSGEEIHIAARGLSPQEAIGETRRKDFPILSGKEIMLQAEFSGAYGQAFTSSPSMFSGSLKEIMEMDLLHDRHAAGLWIASMNAVMAHLGKACCTVHCRNSGPEQCARMALDQLRTRPEGSMVVMAGYQPALLARISEHFSVTVLELDETLIGTEKSGCRILPASEENLRLLDKADLILCTGSTLCNYSIFPYIERKDQVLFYGTTIAGAAALLGLNRLCFSDQTDE